MLKRLRLLLRALALGALFGSGHLVQVSAQTLEGRVLDDQDDRPVATTLVRLVDEADEERAITVADSAGLYRITAPEPGVYRVVAERLGYEPFETLLLEVQQPEGVYPLDLLMRRSPIPIPGLQVTAEQADREVQLMIGVSPRSLRLAPIRFEEIRSHAERGRDLSGLMRWGNTAGLIVMETDDGPCYQARGRGCLPVYLNGFPMSRELIPVIPLDMLHTVVVLYPKESMMYGSGAVLLYTEAWLR